MDRIALDSFFERVYVVNLNRRPDRLQEFYAGLPKDWPFLPPKPLAAIDGQLVRAPAWWKQGNGAWGCYRSHARILEDCLNENVDSVLILEDDAVFFQNFTARVTEFLEHVPSDWNMLYLGGQHLGVDQNPPQPINEYVFRPYNVNRTHAFGVRNRSFMRVLYKYLHNWKNWKLYHHIDHHLGRLHQEQSHKIYCPPEWLVGQAAGESNINGRTHEERFWPAARVIANPSGHCPFTAVLGLHSSGSSAVAGMMYHLGIHMGNKLGGFYGNDPQTSCGFEAQGLADICEAIVPFPGNSILAEPQQVTDLLRKWIHQRQREAVFRKTIAGGKYPMLCRLGQNLTDALNGDLLVVHVERPLEHSIRSLVHRCPRLDPSLLEEHQHWLWEGKQQFLSQLPPEKILTVEYYKLLSQPKEVAHLLAEFLKISPTEERVRCAVDSVHPNKQHIR